MVTRLAGALLEAVRNNRYIDHVQITAAETVTAGTRGASYNAAGALRDMVPNHLFPLLAMIGMKPPNSFDAEAICNDEAKLPAAMNPPRKEDDAWKRGEPEDYSVGSAGPAGADALMEGNARNWHTIGASE